MVYDRRSRGRNERRPAQSASAPSWSAWKPCGTRSPCSLAHGPAPHPVQGQKRFPVTARTVPGHCGRAAAASSGRY